MKTKYTENNNIDKINISVNNHKKNDKDFKYSFSTFCVGIVGTFILGFLYTQTKDSFYAILAGLFLPITISMYANIESLVIKKTLIKDSLINARKNLMLSLIHFNLKYNIEDFDADDTITKIFNSDYVKTDYNENVNYETKTNNMYYILPYKHERVENNNYQIKLLSNKIQKYDLNNNMDIINWFKWHFENEQDFKITTEYDIHKEINFLKENDMFLDSKYDNLQDVNDIRETINDIKQQLINLINDYYHQKNEFYSSLSEKLYSNIKNKKLEYDQESTNYLTNKIKEQKEYINVLKQEKEKVIEK